jgi:hypothetical protein
VAQVIRLVFFPNFILTSTEFFYMAVNAINSRVTFQGMVGLNFYNYRHDSVGSQSKAVPKEWQISECLLVGKMFEAVLRIRIPGSGTFLTPGSGIGFFQIPDSTIISESLKPIFSWVKK